MAFITLSQLTKAVKGLVNKINFESNVTNSKIGQLSSLSTTNKDNLVAAVNEVKSSAITSETDPTVPAWAKAANKPSYTAAEVGALPSTTVIPQIDSTLTETGKAADAKATGDALDTKQPKPYTFSVFHDKNEGADPEYAVVNAPGTIGEIAQLLNGVSLMLSVNNYDDEELHLSTGQIAGINPIVVLFSDISPSASPSEEDAFIITGATAMGALLVGNHETIDEDATITWEYMPLDSADLLTQAGAAAAAPVQSVNGKTGAVSLTASDVGALPSTTTYAASPQVGGSATYANGLHFAQVDSTSTETAFTVTIPGITEYYDGLTIILKNGVVTSASGFTINVNGLGAKHSYNNLAAATADTTIFNINYTMMFVYDSTRVSGGGWICYRGYDANTNTIGYQLRTNSTTMPMSEITYRYRLLFTSADGKKFVPANTSSSTSATATKTVNQTPIDPHGSIVYYGTTASVAAGSRPSTAYLWTRYVVTLGYSFNRTNAALTLTSHAPVYIKAAPQANGSAIIDATTPYVQSLPATADGMIYIFLGTAASATTVELVDEHPIYCYRNGSIQHWTGVQSEIDALTARLDALDVLDEEEF